MSAGLTEANGPLLESQVEQVVRELAEAGGVRKGQLIVFGVSTSEVLGQRIGTAGAMEVAERLFAGIAKARADIGFYPVFQCCEHLNRALVVESELLSRDPSLEPVTVVPVPKAGGAMAAYAYRQFAEPAVVETIRAHAAVDIGGTLIGMHLRPVAVPFRPTLRKIGEAAVTAAYTRPKLIGGARAVYVREDADCTF